MRRPAIIGTIDASHEAANAFAHMLRETRSPNACINKLGLPAHSALHEFIRDGVLSPALPQHMACRVIYHSDLKTLYQDLPVLCPSDDDTPPPGGALPSGHGAEGKDVQNLFGDFPSVGGIAPAPAASPSPSAPSAPAGGGAPPPPPLERRMQV